MDERKLLIADDSELNRAILVSVLEKNFDILEAADGKEAIATLAAHEGNIAALLLDVVMPEADGFEVLEEMNRRGWIDEIPTIMISVETGGSYIDRAFQLGAADYVSRPFVPNMIRRRVINAILLHTKTRKLTGLIADRFYRRERNTDILAAILGYAVEYRSGERGTHMTNVSRITGLLLHRLLERTDRCPIGPEDIETVCIASSLHDIGKLLIPEDILTKPTALTPGEFDIVKQHTRLGAKIISDLPIYQNETIIKYALEICRWHHERWNGEGYPDGLKGDAIPIAAQVVSVADVYDALTSVRRRPSNRRSAATTSSCATGAMNSSCCSATCRSKFWRRNCSPSAQRLTRSSSRSILNCISARASAARSRRDASQERSAGRTLRCIRPN